jgi:tetratricopeptide (TPR) repeat protein
MKRPIKVNIFIFLMVYLFASDILASEDSEFQELFFYSNNAYRQGHFQEAIDGYNQLIQSGHQHGNLFYNLGNAYFRQGQLGLAILNYERAHILIPRDTDLNFNLSYARDKIQDAIPKHQNLIDTALFWIKDLNFAEIFWCFAILNVLFWTTLLIKLFYKFEWIYYISLISFILWMIAGISVGLKWYKLNNDDRAVILRKEVSIFAGPDIKDIVLFKLHSGAIVHYERSEDGWSLVSLADEKRGWIKSEAIELIKTGVKI